MPLSEDILAAMRDTNDVFDLQVVQQGNVAALDEVYTLDARVLPPGAPMVMGREQIKGFWQRAIPAFGLKSAKLETVQAEACGNDVLEIGRATLGLAGGKTLAIKYVVCWRQEQGRWKWAVDIWNANE